MNSFDETYSKSDGTVGSLLKVLTNNQPWYKKGFRLFNERLFVGFSGTLACSCKSHMTFLKFHLFRSPLDWFRFVCHEINRHRPTKIERSKSGTDYYCLGYGFSWRVHNWKEIQEWDRKSSQLQRAKRRAERGLPK